MSSKHQRWWINGQPTEAVPASDRGLAYGDGVFETMRVIEGVIPFLEMHLERLVLGIKTLGMRVPSVNEPIEIGLAWIRQQGFEQATIKLISTRAGSGAGYRPNSDAEANVYLRASNLTLPETPHQVHARFCNHQLSVNPKLAGIKHLNRLDQVMASRELTADEQEGLMFDLHGNLVEAISSNVFVLMGDKLVTPATSNAGVAGVMRRFAMEAAQHLPYVELLERDIAQPELLKADEILLTNAVRGVRNLSSITDCWTSQKTETGDMLRKLLCERVSPRFISF